MDETPMHRALREASPFSQLLGLRLLSLTPDLVVAELTVRPELLNRNGVMHGGALMAMADDLGGSLAFAGLAEGQGTTTMESKTNFLRPVKLGEVLRAEVRPLHRGRRTVICQTNLLREDGKLAAQVTQTQMVLDKDMRTSATKG